MNVTFSAALNTCNYKEYRFLHMFVFFVLFIFRPHKDWICTLLLLLQLVVRQSRVHGGLVRHARVQRYKALVARRKKSFLCVQEILK